MDWGGIKDALVGIAPEIARAAGGPFGMLTGPAARLVLDALGLTDEPEDKPDAGRVQRALAQATPDQIERIKKINADFKVQMEKLNVDLAKVHAGDRASARNLSIETMKATGGRDWGPIIVSAILCAAACFFIHEGITLQNDPAVKTTLITSGFSLLTAVASYWLGSSRSSAQKNDMITAMQNGGGK